MLSGKWNLRSIIGLYSLVMAASMAWGGSFPATSDPTLAAQQRWGASHQGSVVQGCLHGTSETTTATVPSCRAFVVDGAPPRLQGFDEATPRAITYSGGDGTYWLFGRATPTMTPPALTCSAGTHYCWKASATPPAVPSGTVLLLKADVSGAAITAVTPEMPMSPSTVIDVRQHGITCDGATDDTAAWEALMARVPAYSKLAFPARSTCRGNFVATKSLHLDFQGATVINAGNTAALVGFTGVVGTATLVTGNPGFGARTFVVASATGIAVGTIGYLKDQSIRPTDSDPVNYELVKIIAVTGTTLTVEDMIRSDQAIGQVTFTPVTRTINRPLIENLVVRPTASHTWPVVWCLACEGALFRTIDTYGTAGAAVRFELSYDSVAENIRLYDAVASGSGQGFGVQCHRSRVTTIRGVYSSGMKIAVDLECYNTMIRDVHCYHEVSTGPSCVSMSHNGFGGNNLLDGLMCESNDIAVGISGQGITGSGNEDSFTHRDVTIRNVRHVLPDSPTNVLGRSISLQVDYARVLVDNVSIHYVDTSQTPTTSAVGVRLLGNTKGMATVRNVSANEIGAAVWIDRRSASFAENHPVVVENIEVTGEALHAVRFRGVVNPIVRQYRVGTLVAGGDVIQYDTQATVSTLAQNQTQFFTYDNGGLFQGETHTLAPDDATTYLARGSSDFVGSVMYFLITFGISDTTSGIFLVDGANLPVALVKADDVVVSLTDCAETNATNPDKIFLCAITSGRLTVKNTFGSPRAVTLFSMGR